MNFTLGTKARTIEYLYALAKGKANITLENLQIAGLSSGSFSKKEFSDILEEVTTDFPKDSGNYAISVVHPDRNSGTVIGFKQGWDETHAEAIVKTLERYNERYGWTICGIFAYFIPKVNGVFEPERAVAKIFLVEG